MSRQVGEPPHLEGDQLGDKEMNLYLKLVAALVMEWVRHGIDKASGEAMKNFSKEPILLDGNKAT